MRPLVAILLGWFVSLPSSAVGDYHDELAASMRGNVVEVWIKGNAALSHDEILPYIQTRQGTVLELDVLVADVRRLDSTRQFESVRTSYRKIGNNRVVFFRVLERPRLKEVAFFGCKAIREKDLEKEAELKVGGPANPILIEEAREKIEEFYHNHGFADARVTVHKGDKSEDDRAIFYIQEGPKRLAHLNEQVPSKRR
jgi:outer membrane protein insertion porin family